MASPRRVRQVEMPKGITLKMDMLHGTACRHVAMLFSSDFKQDQKFLPFCWPLRLLCDP